MKKFVFYLSAVLLLVAASLSVLIYSIIFCNPGRFDYTYHSVLKQKFDHYLSIDEPKITIIGGSSAGFGINEALIEEETGYPVANLGLHAGFGSIVPTALSKANIQEGDIVLLAYEYVWYSNSNCFEDFGTELVMSAFDNRIDMYKLLPLEFYPKMLGFLFEYAQLKQDATPVEGIYTSHSFDETGRMILDRPEPLFDYTQKDTSGFVTIDIADVQLNHETIAYLKDFKQFVESRGASVYFVAPPVWDAANMSAPEDFAKMVFDTESLIGIDYISNPLDYLFAGEYMYDTTYHCNNIGERMRSELLIQDLKNAGLI